MNRSVRPSRLAGRVAADSSARTVVVPTATTRSAAGARLHGGLGNPVVLAVHLVLCEVVDGDRTEGVETDDQLDAGQPRAAGLARVERGLREMQPGRRRRGRRRSRDA